MTAIANALEVWTNPQEMIEMWEADPNKIEDEFIIKGIVGKSKDLVDLGCGAGRYADVLDYQSYMGYDSSLQMINLAKLKHPEQLKTGFACVDITNFQIPEHTFDTAILIDVAHHQQDPIGFTRKVLSLWKAKRFIFTFVVGSLEERLWASHVITINQLTEFLDEIGGKIIYDRDDGHFRWVVCKK